MKPMGAIPAEFRGDVPLTIAGQSAEQWIAAAGDTPLFVYDFAIVASRIARFRAAMPAGLDLHYAIKANPFAPLIAGDGAAGRRDRRRLGGRARNWHWRSSRRASISFAGPGKRDEEIEAAIRAGVTINLESEGEADRALAIGERLGVTPRLAVRVNPEIELRGSGMRMGGRASPVRRRCRSRAGAGNAADRGRSRLARLSHLRRIAGARCGGDHRDPGGDAGAGRRGWRSRSERTPPLVNLGGGFGIPYFPGEVPLDVEAVGAALGARLADPPASLADTRFAIELGRWLVGESGVYLTRVIDRKESRGETFLVVDGGLHHQLAATGNLGTVVRRNYPIAVASDVAGAETETVSVVGPLCTPLDRLADRVSLPVARPGDVIAVFMAGAYGLSASPTAFLGHPCPGQILAGDGRLILTLSSPLQSHSQTWPCALPE